MIGEKYCYSYSHVLLLLITLIAITTGQILDDKPTRHLDHLALFPEKKTWCDVKQIQQEVALPGCHSKLIPNTVRSETTISNHVLGIAL